MYQDLFELVREDTKKRNIMARSYKKILSDMEETSYLQRFEDHLSIANRYALSQRVVQEALTLTESGPQDYIELLNDAVLCPSGLWIEWDETHRYGPIASKLDDDRAAFFTKKDFSWGTAVHISYFSSCINDVTVSPFGTLIFDKQGNKLKPSLGSVEEDMAIEDQDKKHYRLFGLNWIEDKPPSPEMNELHSRISWAHGSLFGLSIGRILAKCIRSVSRPEIQDVTRTIMTTIPLETRFAIAVMAMYRRGTIVPIKDDELPRRMQRLELRR